MSDLRRFEGEVVLVTGASRGIGRAIAHAFAREGAAVAVLSTDGAGAKTVADEIAAAGGRGLPLAGDVSREEDVRRFIVQAERTLGPLDVLVNNAGVTGPTAPATEIPLAEWQRVLEVDLTGVFLCSREALKGMTARAQAGGKRQPGRIVNIGSMAGKISYPQRTPYASAKWGLIGLTLTLAEEFGPHGIRVNCVCPGPVEGELIQQVIAARARAMNLPVEKVRERYVGVTMMKRFVHPEDVAAAVLFLASSDARNITGQALDVSAGWASMQG